FARDQIALGAQRIDERRGVHRRDPSLIQVDRNRSRQAVNGRSRELGQLAPDEHEPRNPCCQEQAPERDEDAPQPAPEVGSGHVGRERAYGSQLPSKEQVGSPSATQPVRSTTSPLYPTARRLLSIIARIMRQTFGWWRDQPRTRASKAPGPRKLTESVPSSTYVCHPRWAFASSSGGEATSRNSARYTPPTLSRAIASATLQPKATGSAGEATRSSRPSSSPTRYVSYQPDA